MVLVSIPFVVVRERGECRREREGRGEEERVLSKRTQPLEAKLTDRSMQFQKHQVILVYNAYAKLSLLFSHMTIRIHTHFIEPGSTAYLHLPLTIHCTTVCVIGQVGASPPSHLAGYLHVHMNVCHQIPNAQSINTSIFCHSAHAHNVSFSSYDWFGLAPTCPQCVH